MCQTLVSTHVQITYCMRKKVEFQTKKSGGNTSDVYSGTVRFERNPDTEWTDWDPTNVLSPLGQWNDPRPLPSTSFKYAGNYVRKNDKAIPLQAWTGPWGSRR